MTTTAQGSNTYLGLRLGRLYVNGMEVSRPSTTTLTAQAGVCRDSTDQNNITFDSAVTLNTAVVGLNGIDAAGIMTSGAKLYLHAIGSSLGTAPSGLLLSTSKTAPIMPSNAYDLFRYIDFNRNNTSSLLMDFIVTGNSNLRHKRWNLDVTDSAILVAGHAVAFAEVTSMANFMPSSSRWVEFNYDYTPQAAGNKLIFRPTGGGIALGNCIDFITGQVTSVHNSGQYGMATGPAQTIEYTGSHASDSTTLYAAGYVDFI